MSVTDNTLENLFISKVRIKALRYFLSNPDTEIHLRGAVREFKEEINAVRRELTRMEEAKIIKSVAKGNRKYFELSKEHPFISELIGIFHKSYGLGAEIIENTKKLGNVEYAFLTASYTRGIFLNMQIIDMVIVGDIDLKVLEELVDKAQTKLNKEIHYMVLKSSEFQLRKRRRDQLLMDLLMQDNVLLIGNRDELVKF
jgi:DNA-binding transcriptional ArsR family regulator